MEIRQTFPEPWVDRWTTPSPFVSSLSALLRKDGVGLSDFSFNKDAANVGEVYLNVNIRSLNAAVRIGLDWIVFIAANPAWERAAEIVEIFERISEGMQETVDIVPAEQQSTLAFHVTSGDVDFRTTTSLLVNGDLVGEALFYGISLHRSDSVLIIEKSIKYDGAAFVRLQRTFAGSTSLSDVVLKLYDDELSALRLIGIPEVPQ